MKKHTQKGKCLNFNNYWHIIDHLLCLEPWKTNSNQMYAEEHRVKKGKEIRRARKKYRDESAPLQRRRPLDRVNHKVIENWSIHATAVYSVHSPFICRFSWYYWRRADQVFCTHNTYRVCPAVHHVWAISLSLPTDCTGFLCTRKEKKMLVSKKGSRNYRFYRWTNLEVIHDYGIIELLVLIIINILLYWFIICILLYSIVF